jgi:C-terminal processing protease CtpA/Prc
MRSRNTESPLATSIGRWRTARRVILGSIVLAGAMATSAAVMYRFGGNECRSAHRAAVDNSYSYSGIGAVIQGRGDHVIVRSVLPGAPADGAIREGARLISVDGTYPDSVEGWASALKGPEGTSVTIEVAYRCSGHKFVTLERKMIRVTRD